MKYALIIGNNKYNDPKLAQLKTPAADSQALAKILGDSTIGAFDEVTPLINQTESQVRRSISSFLINKKTDDLVLLYFSGHGVLDDRGRLFLALKDTQMELLKATSIPSSFLADEMDSCRSKRQILVLDCCHSGAFERGTKGEQKAITETTFEGSGFGRVVLTASDSTQYALEGDQVIKQTELSLFTHFLLEGLKTGEADTNNDGYISLDEWYDYTYTKVISETPRQVPHKWSYNQQGDLMIARNPFVKKRVVELPYELLQALESPFVGIRESAVNELGKYLRSRDTEMMQLAVSSLEKMKQDDSRRISLLAEKLLVDFERPQAPSVKSGPPLSKPIVVPVTEAAPSPEGDAMASSTVRAASDSIAEARRPQPNAGVSSVPREPVSNSLFWPKWIGGTVLVAVLSVLLVVFLEQTLYLDVAAIKFGLLTVLVSVTQWIVFRNALTLKWIIGNIIAGVLFGVLVDYLFNNSGWGDTHTRLLVAYWLAGNLALGAFILRGSQERFKNIPSILEGGARNTIFLLLLAISLILAAVSNVLLVLDRIQPIFWALYALSAIASGIIFFIKKDLPRNPGFIALALYLVLDGVNVALLVLNSSYPVYYFAFSGIMALASGIYFVSRKETWKNLGFMFLSAYLLTNGLAGMTAITTDIHYPVLLLASLFAVPAAITFFLRKEHKA